MGQLTLATQTPIGTKVDEQLRRRLLVARQQLGTAGRDARTVDNTAEALALLHSTDPNTPYLMLQARTAASQHDIDAAFCDDRSLFRHTTLRRTVFAMPLDVVRSPTALTTAVWYRHLVPS